MAILLLYLLHGVPLINAFRCFLRILILLVTCIRLLFDASGLVSALQLMCFSIIFRNCFQQFSCPLKTRCVSRGTLSPFLTNTHERKTNWIKFFTCLHKTNTWKVWFGWDTFHPCPCHVFTVWTYLQGIYKRNSWERNETTF